MTQWVGAALPRKEDRRMLLGRGRFVADLFRPGLLHAAFVRSPHAHALVTGIDVAAALEVPGVQAVFTAASLGDPCRFSETGAKGMGEGGTIGAPAAILNAINDALSDTGARFDHIPVLPQELSAALNQAGAAP